MVEETKTKVSAKTLPPVAAGEPGYGLGIAGFIVSFFVGVAGLVMSAIAFKQSKAAGRRNSLAFAGLIIGIVKTSFEVLAVAGLIIGAILLGSYCGTHGDACHDNGNYYHGQYDPQDNSGDSGSDQTY